MEELTVDDLRKAMKLFSVPLSEERLKAVADFLNQTLEGLASLTKEHLPKELEPTSYLTSLSKTRENER